MSLEKEGRRVPQGGPWPSLGPEFRAQLASRTPVPFQHGLHEHPQFGLAQIAELAEALPPDSISAESAEKPLVSEAPGSSELQVSGIGEQIRSLTDNNSWFTLLNIEQDPRYRDIVDQVIDGMAGNAGLDAGGLRRRAGFVFASSPGSVTSAHFDIEHSFLLQLQGARTLSYGVFPDDATRNEEIRRYWNGSFGRLAAMPEHVLDIELEPGRGAYIPPYHPHWIRNGDDTSLSLTVVFFNRDNADESMVQAFNERIRKRGLHPRPYGQSPGRDRVKASAMRAYGAVKRRVRPETSAKR